MKVTARRGSKRRVTAPGITVRRLFGPPLPAITLKAEPAERSTLAGTRCCGGQANNASTAGDHLRPR
jgi:hypothetical protein